MTRDEIERRMDEFTHENPWNEIGGLNIHEFKALLDFAVAIHDAAKEETFDLCVKVADDWLKYGERAKVDAADYLAGLIRASKVVK